MIYYFFKRLFDICFSGLVIFLLFPLFLLVAIAIKCTSKGPIFYKSQRVGKDFCLFTCLKFRTMCIDADQKLKELLKENRKLKEEWQCFMKLKKDPRITSIGYFLRKTSIDEFPQFINVLFGDLSVVGPRPYAIIGNKNSYIQEITEYLGPHAKTILSIKPGITGLWQTSGRNELPFKKRVWLDVAYAKKRSFFFDLFLILKTIPVVITSKGAF